VYNGGVRYGQPGIGDGRTSILFAEATTNLVTNPSFETNTTGWATGGSNTIAQSADRAKEGSKSLKCTYQDNVALAYHAISLTAAAHSTGIWIYIPSSYSGGRVAINFVNFAGGVGDANTNADMTKRDQWQFVVVPGYTPDGGDLDGHVQVYNWGDVPTAGDFIYIDAVQCEAKAYATPYCDGSLGTGFTWSGAAHASTSSRVGTYNNIYAAPLVADFDGDAGTFATFLKMYDAGGWTDAEPRWQFVAHVNGDNHIYLYKSGTVNRMNFKREASNVADLISVDGLTTTDWFHAAMTWDQADDKFIAYLDGVQVNTMTGLELFVGDPIAANFGIGALNTGPNSVHNGWLQHPGLWNTALSAGQIANLAVR
jgi:hypothetical protein